MGSSRSLLLRKGKGRSLPFFHESFLEADLRKNFEVQLSLEQPGFEVHGSAYMWILFKNILEKFWRHDNLKRNHFL